MKGNELIKFLHLALNRQDKEKLLKDYHKHHESTFSSPVFLMKELKDYLTVYELAELNLENFCIKDKYFAWDEKKILSFKDIDDASFYMLNEIFVGYVFKVEATWLDREEGYSYDFKAAINSAKILFEMQ